MRVFLALDLLMLPLVALAALEALSFPAKRNEERVRLGQSMGSEKTIRLRRTRSCGREVRRESRRVRESEGGGGWIRSSPGRAASRRAPGPGALLPPALSPPPRSSNRFAPSFFASRPACRRGRRPRSASERDIELRSLTLWCHGVRSAFDCFRSGSSVFVSLLLFPS